MVPSEYCSGRAGAVEYPSMGQVRTRLAVVENDRAYREALVSRLRDHRRISGIDEFSDCESFLRRVGSPPYGLILLDLHFQGMSGLDLLPLLQGAAPASRSVPGPRVIIITTLDYEDTILRAIKGGAAGYLWKDEIRNIGEAIDVVLDGGALISPTIALRLMSSIRSGEDMDVALTAREKQILEMLVQGCSGEKCAATLDISVNTVRKHIRNIYEKLQVKNRMELARKAAKMGLM